MASDYPPLDSEVIMQALVDGFTTKVREGLRAKIMESLEPDIAAAVEVGVASLKTTIEAYADHMKQRTVINVLIKQVPVSHTPKENPDALRYR